MAKKRKPVKKAKKVCKPTKYHGTKVEPLGKIHGGKAILARRVLQLHPEPTVYDVHVEAYGGLASVKLNLPPATRECPRIDIYNDTNGRLVHMFKELRDWPIPLRQLLQTTLYSEAEFELAKDMAYYEICQPLEQARLTYILHQMSFGGQGGSFSESKRRTRRGIADVVSAHLGTIHDMLPEIVTRVQEWQILSRPALQCIRDYDSPRTMFYLDPPYLPETRAKGSKATYGSHEMTYAQHEELLQLLLSCTGKVLISGYDSALYRKYLEVDNQWTRNEIEIANHAAGGSEKRRMTECLWSNY